MPSILQAYLTFMSSLCKIGIQQKTLRSVPYMSKRAQTSMKRFYQRDQVRQKYKYSITLRRNNFIAISRMQSWKSIVTFSSFLTTCKKLELNRIILILKDQMSSWLICAQKRRKKRLDKTDPSRLLNSLLITMQLDLDFSIRSWLILTGDLQSIT